MSTTTQVPSKNTKKVIRSSNGNVLLPRFRRKHSIRTRKTMAMFPFTNRISIRVGFKTKRGTIGIRVRLITLNIHQSFRHFTMPTGTSPKRFSNSIFGFRPRKSFRTPIIQRIRKAPIFIIREKTKKVIHLANSNNNLETSGFPLIIFGNSFASTNPITLIITHSNSTRMSQFTNFIFCHIFLKIILPKDFIFGDYPTFSIAKTFRLRGVITLFFPRSIGNFCVCKTSRIRNSFFSTFTANNAPTNKLIPIRNVIHQVTKFFANNDNRSRNFSQFQLHATVQRFPRANRFPIPVRTLHFNYVREHHRRTNSTRHDGTRNHTYGVNRRVYSVAAKGLPSYGVFVRRSAISTQVASTKFRTSNKVAYNHHPIVCRNIFQECKQRRSTPNEEEETSKAINKGGGEKGRERGTKPTLLGKPIQR